MKIMQRDFQQIFILINMMTLQDAVEILSNSVSDNVHTVIHIS